MHSDTLNALLSAEGAILTDPGEIKAALAMMWRLPDKPLDNDGPVEKSATRICAGNLLVVGHSNDWPVLSRTLGELSPIYPSRTIVVLLSNMDQTSTTHAVRASVSAICHVPQPGRPQVCCEQIILRIPSRCGHDLHRTVLPLLEADVPTTLWWTIDPSGYTELLSKLSPLTDRILTDAGFASFDLPDLGHATVIREIGWYRTWRWRSLLAETLDACCAETFSTIDNVDIGIAGDVPEHYIDAAWLLAFMGGQLGWSPQEVATESRFRFTSSQGIVETSVTVVADVGRGIEHLKLGSGANSFEISRIAPDAGEFRAVRSGEHLCRVARCLQLPYMDRTATLASALSTRIIDPVFQRASPLAHWLIHARTSG